MSNDKSNPILESLLLTLAVHVVILAVVYFSDEYARGKLDDKSPPAVIEFIELDEKLLEIEPKEPKSRIENLLNKYKNFTANANDIKTNAVANNFNRNKVDQQVLDELLAMEEAEFQKLKKDGLIPEDLNQKELEKPPKDDTPKENPDPNSKKGESYAAATSEYDFSRDPDKRRNPTYKCISFGQIVIEITVNRDGNVISANAVSGDLDNDCLKSESEAYARRWKFAAKFDAPKSEKGTITFTFLPQ